MSNEQYWEDDNLENELNRSNSNEDAGIANLRKAKRADEKRIKELEEQLAKFSRESNERTVREILESKGVNPKATRLILKDLDTINEDAVSNWLVENGDVIGYTPGEQKVDTENLRALKQQDSATESADTPAYSEDLVAALSKNYDSEEELLAVIKSLA